MARIIIYIKHSILIFLGILLSCNNHFCKNENFYSIYQTRFEVNKLGNDFVKNDLEFKRKIFSTLCIPSSIKKMLIVEYRSGTRSFYSRGLLFTYDDSIMYYFKIRNNKMIAGKGNGGNIDLNKILFRIKKDFSSEKTKLNKEYNDIFDTPIVNVLLYDSLMPRKFDNFSFPIVILDPRSS